MSKELAWLPDLIYANNSFLPGMGLSADAAGNILQLSALASKDTQRLRDRALLPGLVNAHSHAFQRVIRGRTEHRTKNRKDSFWTWREMMYSAANRLSPEDIYDASRMAFLEMALSGITSVGEFHYLHHDPYGYPYQDTNLLASQVIQAALDVGLRIVLLRVAYARAGFRQEANPLQRRFIEADPEVYLRHTEHLKAELAGSLKAHVGLAPHSVRAVPVDYLKQIIEFALQQRLVVHMHVAEQPAEVSACIDEHGKPPIVLLHSEGLLSEQFTAVHAIHITTPEITALARTLAKVCACPTTERNLGDGIVPAADFLAAGVGIALGSDSQVQIDLLEDARQLEYHLRLQRLERAVLTQNDEDQLALARRLFKSATVFGGESLGIKTGELEPGRPADFFTVRLNDPSLAGAFEKDLLPAIVFSLNRAAISEVFVGGEMIVSEGRHKDQDEIVTKFEALQKRLWSH